MNWFNIIYRPFALAVAAGFIPMTVVTAAIAASAPADQGSLVSGPLTQCREQAIKAVRRATVHARIVGFILDRRDLESRFIRARWMSDDTLEVAGFVPTRAAATALRDATARYAVPATTKVNLMVVPEITNKASRNTWVSEAADDLVIHGRIAAALLSPAARLWLANASLQAIVVREGCAAIFIIEDGPLPDRAKRLRPHLAVPGVTESKLYVLENFDEAPTASANAGNQ